MGPGVRRDDGDGASPQQPLPRHMVHLQSDPVGILEQQRVIARRPGILARRATDFDAVERAEESVQLVDVDAFAGAEAEMVLADAILFECRAGMLRRWRADSDRRAA